MNWASRIAKIVTCVAGLSTVGACAPTTGAAQVSDVNESTMWTLVGAGVGVATGFGLAGLTGYELQEGGALVVVLLGGGMGGVTAHKLATSRGRQGQPVRRIQVTFPWAVVWSKAPQDIEAALSESGYGGSDSHHSLAPAVSVTVDAPGPLQIGAEISGVRGARVRDEDEATTITESVDGRSLSLFVLLARKPSQGHRLTYFGGGGVAQTAITVLSYFDQKQNSGLPPDLAQPSRSSRAEAKKWHPLLRAGLEFNLTMDVGVRLEGMRRWTQGISVPAIELLDATGNTVRQHGGHAVSLRSFQVSLGFNWRY